jgi:hypothetical protein
LNNILIVPYCRCALNKYYFYARPFLIVGTITLSKKLKPSITTPIIIKIDPFIVQEGLSYINELAGPIIDLDCAVKIIPSIISNIPIVVTMSFNDQLIVEPTVV